MSNQDFEGTTYASDHVAVTDMANIDTNFDILKNSFAGSVAPPNTERGMLWFDSGTNGGYDGLLKVRHDDDGEWLAVLCGDNEQKFWVYRDSTMDGWQIDTGVTDRVLALKGGSDAYDRTGGGTAGETWANLKAHIHTGGSHTHEHGNHIHQVYTTSGSGDHGSYYNSAGSAVIMPSANWSDDQQLGVAHASGDYRMNASMYTKLALESAGDTSAATGNTGGSTISDIRPAAAVGTLQYADITATGL